MANSIVRLHNIYVAPQHGARVAPQILRILKFREVTAELPSHGMPADRAGYSFSIRLGCENQAEIDRLWEALGERGEHQAAARG